MKSRSASARAFWRIDPRPDGRPAPDGPVVDGVEDKIELVASNLAVSIAPASLRSTELRSDITTIPIEDAPPGQVVIATRQDDHSASSRRSTGFPSRT
ncbi:MAG TPA: hypothetical protein VG674_05840 [Amycolatopsis sp.]|nr:hypothetical protein [Amycolatopsis sp.]